MNENNHTKKNINRHQTDYWSLFFLLLAILLGGYARLWQILTSHFPLNDGGMFYQMTQELIANHYHLPLFTHYNNLQVPFAYPPLPFYVIGFLSDSLQINLLDLFRILPAVISIFAIPAMYCLAKEITGDKAVTTLATILFSLLPSSFDWLIMGGGISRSLGFVFSLMTLLQTIKLYKKHSRKHVISVALFSSLTILSHPEAILHTTAGVLIIFLFWGRSRKGIQSSVQVLILTIIATAPWWVINLQRHSLEPFLAAGKTGWHHLDAIFPLWKFAFTNELNLSITGVFSLVGLFLVLVKKEYFLPVWLFVSYAIEPRSATLFIAPILAILAAKTIKILFVALNKEKYKPYNSWAEELFQGTITKIAFAFFLSYWVFSAYGIPMIIKSTSSLTTHDTQAFRWIKTNIPSNSKFIILTQKKPLTDPVSEWFPALTGMISLSTPQGQEWNSKTNFTQLLKSSVELQDCFEQKAICLQKWQTKMDVDFTYIYFQKTAINPKNKLHTIQSPLEMSLLEAKTYQQIYDSGYVSILRKTDTNTP